LTFIHNQGAFSVQNMILASTIDWKFHR